MKKAALIAFISLLAQPTTHVPIQTAFIRSGSLFKQILKNQPSIDANYAVRLSNAILASSLKHKVNPVKVSAILAQECRYKLNCINTTTLDYSIGQINIRTIKAFKMDKKRLMTDLEYAVEMSVVVLADFKRMYGKKEPDWFTRYNSSNFEKRKKYGQLIAKFL